MLAWVVLHASLLRLRARVKCSRCAGFPGADLPRLLCWRRKPSHCSLRRLRWPCSVSEERYHCRVEQPVSTSDARLHERGVMLTGSCHCGSVQIQVERRPRQLTSCNCSVCRRHAGLWGYYDRHKVKVVAKRGALAHYIWGDQALKLFRCATCGCVTHWLPTDRTGSRMGVNFRNFAPSVVAALRVRKFDGADTWKFLD